VKRLWVIDPSENHPEEQGTREVLRGWLGESRIFRPVLSPGDGPGPDTGYETDGVVLMGSAASPHDPRPWISELATWLAPILDGSRALPLLGICFGHQMIAHCAGAEVGFITEDRTKLHHVCSSQLDSGRLIGETTSLRVVVSHREEVKSCPAGYRVVARRDPIAIDGLEHVTLPIFCFQFHPEAGDEFAVRADIPVDDLDDRQRRDSRRVLEAFRQIVDPDLSPLKK